MQRGAGWSWDNQDGGRGNTGLVEEVKQDRSVWVRWSRGNKNVYQESDLTVVGYVKEVNVGDIVERGPDWKHEDQDGGVGNRGIVMRFATSGLEVICKWENGREANYRWGYAYDLKVVKSIR